MGVEEFERNRKGGWVRIDKKNVHFFFLHLIFDVWMEI